MAKLEKRQRNLLVLLGVMVVAFAIDFTINSDDYLKYYGTSKGPKKKNIVEKKEQNKIAKAESKLIKYDTWSRDPFYDSTVPVKRKRPKRVVKEVALTLQAISFSEGKSVAMINSEILAVGGIIEGYRVKKIQPKQVILEKGGRTRTLKLQ